jgi:aspartyl/glutamyl-tRNA(Asn/Gln) amidotransferase C subunit
MSAAKASVEDVRRLASLARVHLPEESLSAFVQDFDAVLAYVSTLETLTLPTGRDRVLPRVRNVLREDGEPHVPGIYSQAIIAQFPDREGDLLSVKQIITHD